MRMAIRILGVLAVLIGASVVWVPNSLIAIAYPATSPTGLYVVALWRIGLGIALMRLAPVSRAPKTLRVLAPLLVIAGIATPFFGSEQADAALVWVIERGSSAVRAVGVVIAVVGGVLWWVVWPRSAATTSR